MMHPTGAAAADRRRRDKHAENDATDRQCLHGAISIFPVNKVGPGSVPR
jgi:hypothetical protein